MYELDTTSEIAVLEVNPTTKLTIARTTYIINNAFTKPYKIPPTSSSCFKIGNDVIASATKVNANNATLTPINITINTIKFIIFSAIAFAV